MDHMDLLPWLRARPENTRKRDTALIAMRAVARVFPLTWQSQERYPKIETEDPRLLNGLQTARCLLASFVGELSETSETKAALLRAANVLTDDSANSIFNVAAHSVGHAAMLSAKDEQNYDDYPGSLLYPINHACLTSGIAARLDAEADATHKGGSNAVEEAAKNWFWQQIKFDLDALCVGADLTGRPLWVEGIPIWFVRAMQSAHNQWASDPNDTWNFWTRWWDGLVAGQPLDWALQEKVALIPNAIWQQGPAAVARAIREIEEQDGYHVSQATRAKAEKLLRAAVGTFTFDQVRGLITLGPFAEDLAFIKQSEVIDRFLAAAADVRERIDALQTSFEREGRGMQGAATLQVYLGKIDEEFSKARQVQVLRVGTLLNWVNILRTIAADDSTRREISPLHVPLDDLLNGLDDLIRTYFAQALVRVAPLKDIRSDENVPLADLLQDVRRGMDVIRASEAKELVPLAPEVIAIFDDTLADLDLLVRAELSEPLPAWRSALRREFDFQWAQIVVSWLLYREAAIKNAGWAVDALSSWGAMAGHVLNLRELIKWVIGFFTAP
jgi:hypothetical protein